ncbi:Crp/Fnr family transcriptional regulator [Roseobacter sp. HKCCA0434]|uniref:Crp/Fnr family transcriptional regulator n=1 Tax=Roseobacter sp. HKCCA0434 TaxID=3079297 RepID=UPI00290583D0|nr:Crp/Fnr family transcriptional regulator [Roseobacter sp. HKCCA0434]
MTKRSDIPSRLRQVPLLSSLSDGSLDALAKRVDIVRPRRGELVVQHLDASDDFYLVLEGRVMAILISGRGREVALGEMGPGAYFGEIAAIGGGERSASVFARSAAMLARIPGRTLRALLQDEPELARLLLADMVERVRDLTQRSFELTALKLADRLRLYLVRKGLEHGVLESDGVLKPAPTHAEMAAHVGANREAVSRELSLMVQQELIETRRGSVTFLRPDVLLETTNILKGE